MLRASRHVLKVAAPASEAMKMIRELRFRTDAPIVDCKAALTENGNDMDAAITWLKAKGAASSVKKHGRETLSGVLTPCIVPGKAACVLQVCSETDFAARNDKFAAFVDTIRADAETFVAGAPADIAANADAIVAELQQRNATRVAEAVASIGENITIAKAHVLPLPEPPVMRPKFAVDGVEPSMVVGRYVHNAVGDSGNAGLIVGLVGLWSYCDKLRAAEADDLAQHMVAHLGAKSELAQQSFLGTSETAGQWMKRHGCKLRCGLGLKFADLEPTVVRPVENVPPQFQRK